jgi:nucleoside-diphosphate-sugar epimerase
MWMSKKQTVVVAGATGSLGGRIVKSLVSKGADVRATVRKGTASDKLDEIRNAGANVVEVDLTNLDQVRDACSGASCVISALLGLRDVIVGTQRVLLEGSVLAKVPRFIPSDFSANYTHWPQYENRTLDLRREFKSILDKAPIRSTSILNGAFLDLLVWGFPAFNPKARTVTYWGDPDKKLEFTKLDDIAAFAAHAALDPSTPRMLKIVGERISARELAALASELTGEKFDLIDGGSIETLSETISGLKLASDPGDGSVYPAWQLKMYMRSMFTRSAEVEPLDNDRYPQLHWTSARQLLEQYFAASRA